MGRGLAKSPSAASSLRGSRPCLLIPVGIPGAGKSTLCKQLEEHDYQTISTDAIRKELWGDLSQANAPEHQAMNNELVFTSFYALIRSKLQEGRSVVADATNLYASARQQLLQIATECNAVAQVVLFDNLAVARQQNVEREAEQVVPPDVMDKMEGLYLEAAATIENPLTVTEFLKKINKRD